METSKCIYEKIIKSPAKILDLEINVRNKFSENKIYYSNKRSDPSLPLLVSEKEHLEIQKSSEKLSKIMNKTVSLIFKEKSTGNYLRIYKDLWSSILKEREQFKNKNNFTFSKLNGTFDNDGVIKYFEYRADSRDFLYGDKILQIYNTIKPLADFFKENNIAFFNKTSSGLTRFLGRYSKKINFHKKKNRIGIIPLQQDFRFELYNNLLASKGYNVFTISHKDLISKVKSLYPENGKSKLFLLTGPMKNENIKYLEPLIEAYLSGKVKLLDFICSSLASEKTLFALISDPKNHKFYSNSEISFINKHIPWTRVIRHERTTDISGHDVDLIEYIIKNQDKLVLKTSSSFLGGQVGVAYEMNKMDWKTLISWILSCNEYWVVQEKIHCNKREGFIIKEDKLTHEKLYWSFKPVLLNNRFQTCYGNTSIFPVVSNRKNVIALPLGFQKST